MSIEFTKTVAVFDMCEGPLDIQGIIAQLETFVDEAPTAQDESAWSFMYDLAYRSPSLAGFRQDIRDLDRGDLKEKELQVTLLMRYVLGM